MSSPLLVPMPQPDSPFVPTEHTRVKRLPERGKYDRETVYAILNAALVCHVGYTIDGRPYVTPTACWREGNHLLLARDPRRAGCYGQSHGIPVCVTVTHLHGLVLARSAFHHSINYRSVMAFGNAEMIQDADAKLAALRQALWNAWFQDGGIRCERRRSRSSKPQPSCEWISRRCRPRCASARPRMTTKTLRVADMGWRGPHYDGGAPVRARPEVVGARSDTARCWHDPNWPLTCV